MALAQPPAHSTPIAGTDTDTDAADGYVRVATRGLRAMYDRTSRTFPYTARLAEPGRLAAESASVRYTAIAILGIGRLPEDEQREILDGALARDLVPAVARSAMSGSDPGAWALAAWASAELEQDGQPSDRLAETIRSGRPIPTVDFSWTLTALATTAARAGNIEDLAAAAAARLMSHQADNGLFPHMLPPAAENRLRAHVACFADQVYPILALARYATTFDDPQARAAADRCAARIVELQGQAGQWWWHYDIRTAGVVEHYPVYSVHQHAMGPMALFELRTAGGQDFGAAAGAGLAWIAAHPEQAGDLVAEDLGVIWRKVGRREPRKAVRSIRSVTTSIYPGWRLNVLDRLFPPVAIDHECRPYELGWLLYAWLPASRQTAAG